MVTAQILRILVDAGATPVSAARAAVVLESGGTAREAEEEIELALEPATFDAELLLAQARRAQAMVKVEREIRREHAMVEHA